MESNSSPRRKESASKRHAKFDFSQSAASHFVSESEISAYINWINTQLSGDPDLSELLPIPSRKENALFEACNDGLLLCKLINNSVPGTIVEKQLNKSTKSVIHKHENLQKALSGAVKIGVQVHNLAAEDLLKGTPHLCLGLIWQVIKVGLLSNVTSGPESTQNSSVDIAGRAEPSTHSLERALLKWVNGTLNGLGLQTRITNFGSDLSDSHALAFLIASFDDNLELAQEIVAEPDLIKRAEGVLQYAEKFDCRHFASASDIVDGNKNLNLAFVAVLHNLKVSRDKNKQVRIQLEASKEDAEAKLLRVASSKDVELKRLKLQLSDATDEAERLKYERDAYEAELNQLRVHAEQQEDLSADNANLSKKLADLEHELSESRTINHLVSSSVDSLTNSVSEVYSMKKSLEDQLQTAKDSYDDQLALWKSKLHAAEGQIKALEIENQILREKLHEAKSLNESMQSFQDLTAPANSFENLNNNQEEMQQLAEELARSNLNAQSVQYRLLALQTQNDEQALQLDQALKRARLAEEQVQASTESLNQLYANAKSTGADPVANDTKQEQKELVRSIDTVFEETLALQLLSKEDPSREIQLQEQIQQMQQLTVQLAQQATVNETQVIERVFADLRKQKHSLFDDLQMKTCSEQDLVKGLTHIVLQLQSKADMNEKKAQAMSESVDTLNCELQKLVQEKKEAVSVSEFRDAHIDSVPAINAPTQEEQEKAANKHAFAQLENENSRLEDRLQVLNRTTAAIMEQRSLLIDENKRLADKEKNNREADADAAYSIGISRQIQSLDKLLEHHVQLRAEMQQTNFGDQLQNANRLSMEVLALQTARVQAQVDAMIKSEDCLIEDLTSMRTANEELHERLDGAQRCIAALMAQRSILLKERDELMVKGKDAFKSQESIAESNEGLSQTKHNNSFASAPNMASSSTSIAKK
ncbi:hypothetical protein BJ741DRAFT_624325 [Chytriomyces cf. hyalinus JEL632]|nr:hypothetical protein BJ741DRAFT_624325 [Chytriomyces cf. hyalinus JEL632]